MDRGFKSRLRNIDLVTDQATVLVGYLGGLVHQVQPDHYYPENYT